MCCPRSDLNLLGALEGSKMLLTDTDEPFGSPADSRLPTHTIYTHSELKNWVSIHEWSMNIVGSLMNCYVSPVCPCTGSWRGLYWIVLQRHSTGNAFW